MTDDSTTQQVAVRTLAVRDVEVTVPLDRGWSEVRRSGGVTLQLGEPDGTPVPTIGLDVLEGRSRAVLDAQVAQASTGLTDLALLHLGLVEVPAANWKDTEPDARTAFGTYRQGMWTMALRFGLLAADGDRRCLLLTAICAFEDWAMIAPVVDELVAQTEVAW